MTQVYVKTPKGLEEMTHRSDALTQRERQVLILMDGKRRPSELTLGKDAGDLTPFIERLLAQGFISPLVSAAPATPATGAAPVQRAPEDDAQRLDMARNFMMNTVRTFIGVSGSALINELEACDSFEQLRERYGAWHRAVALTGAGRKDLPGLEKRLAALLS